MTGSLFPFVRLLVLFHLCHFGDWDLCFFPVSWELFNVESGQYRIDARCVRLFFGLCTGRPLASDFTIFGVFGFVGFVVSVLLLCLMRTAILAGGIAVVRSGFCFCFAEDGEWLRFVHRRLDY